MWSIINNKDAFNEKHHHGNSALSAAYYVKAEENAGNIVSLIQDSECVSSSISRKINNINAQAQSVTPEAGT